MANRRSSGASPAAGGARLTWAEIRAQHPGEWVVLVGMEWADDDEDGGALLSAIVLGHSPDRGRVLRDTKPVRPPGTDSAHLFTGDVRAPAHPLAFW